jgi:hypothetical protein
LGAQTPRRPLQGCSTISTFQPSTSLTHEGVATLLVRTIGPDQLEPRKASLEWPEQFFAAVMILNVGLVHQHAHDQPGGIDEQVPDASFHALAAVVAAPPPISLVFTD